MSKSPTSWLTIASKLINWFRLMGKRRHKNRIKAARKTLHVLRQIQQDHKEGKEPRALAYLRKINSAAFEELALTLFEESGFFVLRNKAYTGDGGIDGRVHIPYLGFIPVQSKRYAGHIQMQHVKDFARVVKQCKKPCGFFIHTGRTGEGSREQSKIGTILIFSGFDLVRCGMGTHSIRDMLQQRIDREAQENP